MHKNNNVLEGEKIHQAKKNGMGRIIVDLAMHVPGEKEKKASTLENLMSLWATMWVAAVYQKAKYLKLHSTI